MKNNTKLAVYDIVLIGIMVATLEGGKLALSFLPNVEIVTLLIILYTLYFGRKVFYVLITFILLEGCIYGFGLWFVMYLYAWPLLALITLLFKHWLLRSESYAGKKTGVLFFSLLSAFWGLFFGALCAIPYIFVSGIKGAFAWWIAGIPFDIIHCVSNFILMPILFKPLSSVLYHYSDSGSRFHGTDS